MRRALLTAVFWLVVVVPIKPAGAELNTGAPLPCGLQLTLLSKVLSFDRSLAGRSGGLDIVVLYQADYPESETAKAEFMRAARALSNGGGAGFRFKVVRIEGKPNFRDIFAALEADAVYVLPLRGLDVQALVRAAAAQKIRTFSGTPEYVYEGVSVTMGNKQGRPAIYINLPTSKAQGSDFSSQLLKLANVVE